MKKLLIAIAFLMFNFSFSQEFIGSWKVKQISDSKESEEMKKMFSEIFLNSEFTFTTDKKFQFVTTSKSKASLEFTKGFSNTSWILNSKNQEISIGSKKDNYSIIKMFYKEVDGIMYFQMHEFDYIFLMEKVQKI